MCVVTTEQNPCQIFSASKMLLSRPVALAAVGSKCIALLLLSHCLLLMSYFVGGCFGPFYYALISFVIISLRMKELFALL